MSVPSRSPYSSILWDDCYIAGSGESGYIAVKPDDPDVVFVGAIGSSPGGGNSLQRYDHRTQANPPDLDLAAFNHRTWRIRQKNIVSAWTYPIIILTA